MAKVEGLPGFSIKKTPNGDNYRLTSPVEKQLIHDRQKLKKLVDEYFALGIEVLKSRQLSTSRDPDEAERVVSGINERLDAGDYSDLIKTSFYVSTTKSGDKEERANFHVHIDAQELLSGRTTVALLGAGLAYDLFDPNAKIYGADGDPKKSFGCHNPAQHMTLATRSFPEFIDRMAAAINIITESGRDAYIEGEYITYDEKIESKPFNRAAYDALVPLAKSGDNNFTFVSAITGETRVLPARAIQRRLNPGVVDPKRGIADSSARNGEIHLTLRNDTHPLLLELFGNIGFACPAITKFIEGDDGKLQQNVDNTLREVTDYPLTIQTLDMKTVQKVGNLVVSLCEMIGGVNNGSWKLEIAPQFWVGANLDYNKHVPPVVDQLHIHERFSSLPEGQIGRKEVNPGKEARMMTEIAKGSDVVRDGDKRAAYHAELFCNTAKAAEMTWEELTDGTSFARRQTKPTDRATKLQPSSTWRSDDKIFPAADSKVGK